MTPPARGGSAPVRVVVDANVLASGLYRSDGPPGRIVGAAVEGTLRLFAPETVLWELDRTFVDKMGFDRDATDRIVGALPVEWIEEALYADAMPRAKEAISDPQDVPVVACALALGLDIVSGDKDFHPLDEPWVGTWTPRDYIEEHFPGDD